jgi:hypothetical protein
MWSCIRTNEKWRGALRSGRSEASNLDELLERFVPGRVWAEWLVAEMTSGAIGARPHATKDLR